MRTKLGGPLASVLSALLVMLLAACGGADDSASDLEVSPTTVIVTDSTVDEANGTTSEAPTDSTTTTMPTTEPSDATTTTASSTSTTAGGVPGQPLDFGPALGTPLAVVGVQFDDSLNFRRDPSPSATAVASIAPLSGDTDISYAGESWSAPGGIWWKVNLGGEELWANQAFLGGLGAPNDIFTDVAAQLGVLKFETLEDAALAVAAKRASVDPASSIVFAGEPLGFSGVGGFAIVDVIGLGDDSVKGERLRVEVEFVYDETSGEEGAQDIAFVVLTAVEATPICGRGVSDGLCV